MTELGIQEYKFSFKYNIQMKHVMYSYCLKVTSLAYTVW